MTYHAAFNNFKPKGGGTCYLPFTKTYHIKKYLFTSLATLSMVMAFGQNGISGATGLYGAAYVAATTINTGGNVWVSTGGNWAFGGNIISFDKGEGNTPTTTGRGETITFDGTGGFTANSFMIDGYAATTATQTAAPLPFMRQTAKR